MDLDRVIRCALALAAACLASPSPAFAQSPAQVQADAAERDRLEQRRAEERERSQREALQRGADAFGDTATTPSLRAWPAEETPCFVIQRVRLQGDAAGSFDWVLNALTQGPDAAIGRCLGPEGISVAAARAQRHLMAQGFVTSRVLIESQDLSGGTLALTLLPGRISAIRFADDTPARATWQNAMPARPSDILNLRDIEQALENLRRVPTVQADIQITPGDAPGQSELLIRWRQLLPLRLDLSLDDGGSHATGRYQGSATIGLDNPLALNDAFHLTLGHDLGGGAPGARGSRHASLHHSLPLGHWQLGFNASRHHYFQTVAGLAQDYRYSGHGAQQDATLSRIVHRDGASKTSVALKVFARQSSNFIDDTEVEVQRRRTGGWELGADHRHQVGRHRLDLRAAFKRGTGAFGALPAAEEASGEGRSRFALVTLDAAWSQALQVGGLPMQWRSHWRGQRERTPLTPQDRFATGIAPIFDRHRVQQEIDAQIKITAEFGKSASKTVGDHAGKKYNELKDSDPEEAAKWAEGGAYRVAAHALVGGLAGGASGAAGAGLASLSADAINQLTEGMPDGVRQLVGTGVAAGLGAVAGGSAGAATALNADVNNRQLHPTERQLARELARKSGGKYTAEEIENALRTASNRKANESVVTSMVVAPAAVHDPNAVWTLGENGQLVQVLPAHPAAELAVFIQQNTGETYSWYTPRIGEASNDPSVPRDRMTGRPLDDKGRYAMRVEVGNPLNGYVSHEPKYFPCATTECLRTGANLDMSDPATRAYVKALDAQVFKDIGAGATVGSLVTPVGVPGAVLGITGVFASLGESVVQEKVSEGVRDEAIKTISTTGATAFFRDVLGHSASSSARAVALIELAGGWDAFVERVKVDLLGMKTNEEGK